MTFLATLAAGRARLSTFTSLALLLASGLLPLSTSSSAGHPIRNDGGDPIFGSQGPIES